MTLQEKVWGGGDLGACSRGLRNQPLARGYGVPLQVAVPLVGDLPTPCHPGA